MAHWRTEIDRSRQMMVYDPGTLAWVPAQQAGAGAGGGGAASIADGADVVQGALADAAVITDTSGTLSGKLRGIIKLLASVISGSRVLVTADSITFASPQHVIVDSTPTTAVTGPLTDTQLRAAAVPVSGAFFQITQPVSAASLPLPTGAGSETTLAAIKAKTDNLDVALSTRTKPADTQTVSGTVAVSNLPSDQLVHAINFDVALSTRTKPADQQHAIVDSSALPIGASTETTLALIKARTDVLSIALGRQSEMLQQLVVEMRLNNYYLQAGLSVMDDADVLRRDVDHDLNLVN